MSTSINYEDAIKELEEIVRKLEKGDMPLELSLELFQKGVELSSVCNKILDDTEKKMVTLLSKNGDIQETPWSMEENNEF